MQPTWFATVAPGLEDTLAGELRDLGVKCAVEAGGCVVRGSVQSGWSIALHSRVASGILARVGVVRAPNSGALTGAVRKLPWAEFVHPRQPVEVRWTGPAGRIRRDGLEAAVRRGVEQALKGPRLPGGRPPRSTAHILVRPDQGGFELSIDAAGERLHRRGWRKATAKAPLRENLAAAILRLAGWTPSEFLLDPMCGSGTFPIEAGQIALGIPPGGRRSFAFEDWPSHDARAWKAFKARTEPAAATIRGIAGSDRDEGAVRAARSNLERSGARRVVQLSCIDFRELESPAQTGLIVCNPPWGLRVGGDGARGAWAGLGRVIRERFGGWRIALVGPSPDLVRAVGLPMSEAARFPAGGQRLRLWIGEAR